MSKITTICPACKAKLSVSAEKVGKTLMCPKCQNAVAVTIEYLVEVPVADVIARYCDDPPKRSAMEWVYMRWVALALAGYAGYAGYRQLVPRAAMDTRSLTEAINSGTEALIRRRAEIARDARLDAEAHALALKRITEGN